MAKATIKHTRVRRDRHPNTQKSKRDSSAAPADHVLVLAEAIEAKEREQACASRNGDKKLGRLLDDELSELDDRLALAVPSSWAGAAFKLRKGVHFSDSSTAAAMACRHITSPARRPPIARPRFVANARRTAAGPYRCSRPGTTPWSAMRKPRRRCSRPLAASRRTRVRQSREDACALVRMSVTTSDLASA